MDPFSSSSTQIVYVADDGRIVPAWDWCVLMRFQRAETSGTDERGQGKENLSPSQVQTERDTVAALSFLWPGKRRGPPHRAVYIFLRC